MATFWFDETLVQGTLDRNLHLIKDKTVRYVALRPCLTVHLMTIQEALPVDDENEFVIVIYCERS